jgi:siderophore synthetase component
VIAVTAADASAHTLLNCLLREVCGPAGQVSLTDGHVVLRLPRRDVVLRARLRRRSVTGAHRFSGPVEQLVGGGWTPLPVARLAARVAAELELHSGVANPEFVDQVRASETAVGRALAHRARAAAGPALDADPRMADYLDSEQALVFGHRFHPSPKARQTAAGSPEVEDERTWLAYAPEARAAFPLRLLGVPVGLTSEGHTATGGHPLDAVLDAAGRRAGLPAGHTVLPVHPWQFEILTRDAGPLHRALREGRLLDLGPSGPRVVPTASVRTLYDPAADVFYKTGLHVRITNCVRRSAGYELRGAVALTRLLAPLAADLSARFGAVLLGEPAYRTVVTDPQERGTVDLADALGVIVRDGFAGRLRRGVTPLLAAAVADEYPTSRAHVSHLVRRLAAATGTAESVAALRWWRGYLGLLVPPVLYAYFRHGVVLEPHLQNVLVGVGTDGSPCQVLLRDLEGVKLTRPDLLDALPADLRPQVGYDADRGWDRVVYCLLVNNAGELAAALADLHPGLEDALWDAVRDALDECAAGLGSPARLRALRDGRPLPAKANLLTRWARSADRHARYAPAPCPLAPRALR